MKKNNLNENTLRSIIRRTLLENDADIKNKKKARPSCLPENTIPLDEIVGQSDNYERYSPGIKKRKSGVNSIVDTLGILNNVRWANDVRDGGSHLAYEMMNHLNKFRNKNYFDETTQKCHKAMDKVIELYKENEHGTELVKDIERVLNLQTKDDEHTPSPRTKEYLKQCINLAKGE